MPNNDLPQERWAGELEVLGRKLKAHARAIVAAGSDPFAQREQVERINKTLSEVDLDLLKGPPELLKTLDIECIEASAEFWQRFCSAANDNVWEVHGSTERRLVSRAFFVELKDDNVRIDGIPGRYTPNVPALIRLLKPRIDSLVLDKGTLQQFAELLAKAYDDLGGRGETSIEAIFRQCVLLVQPATFWANIEPAKLQPLSRPVFRSRLSAILAESVRLADGRELRLTPTVNRKDVWELYSPAEGRVVQVGRLAFLNTESLK